MLELLQEHSVIHGLKYVQNSIAYLTLLFGKLVTIFSIFLFLQLHISTENNP